MNSAVEIDNVPGHVPSDRVIHFDFLRDPNLPADPYRTFKGLQQHKHDIVWTTANGGHWIALRRDTIKNIMTRSDLFSNAHIDIPPMLFREIKLIPEELDPPEHEKYRRLLNPLLSPAVIREMEQNARTAARNYIAAFFEKGHVDIMTGLTVPLPCSIFMSLLGLDASLLPNFLKWKDAFFFVDDKERKAQAIGNIAAAVKELAHRRRLAPNNDMMSKLVTAQVDGRPLTEEELLSMGFLLFLAGLDTVTSAMTSCFAYLAQNSTERMRLVNDPKLIPDAVEEMVRRYSVVNLVRTVIEDCEFEGLQLRKGEQFVASTLLANLDDRHTGDGLAVDFTRSPNAHLGFGLGPHRCAGSHLARVELRVVLEEALPRLKNMRIPSGHELHYHSANLVGLSELPLEWDVE
jgi:cytochrome P450